MPPKKRGRRPKTVHKCAVDADKQCFVNQVKAQANGQFANLTALKDEKLSMLQQVVILAKKRLGPELGNMRLKDFYNASGSGPSCGTRKRSSSTEIPIAADGGKRKVRKRSFSCDSRLPGYQLQTPAGTSTTGPGMSFLITPKVNFNSPIGMLRHAQQGELAVSTSGSPLLVSSNAMTDFVNVNLPLKDGKVLSLFPHPNLSTENIGSKLNPNIRQQLSVLTNTLQLILQKDRK